MGTFLLYSEVVPIIVLHASHWFFAHFAFAVLRALAVCSIFFCMHGNSQLVFWALNYSTAPKDSSTRACTHYIITNVAFCHFQYWLSEKFVLRGRICRLYMDARARRICRSILLLMMMLFLKCMCCWLLCAGYFAASAAADAASVGDISSPDLLLIVVW